MITAASLVGGTASEQKLAANRTNAQRSTGPVSDAGKARSSQNARKHGIFCQALLAPGEDPADLEQFKNQMVQSLNPRDMLELQFVEQIIADEWRIKRIRSAEQAVFERLHAADQKKFDEQLSKLQGQREKEMDRDIARASDPNSKFSQRYPHFRAEYVRITEEWAKTRANDPVFTPSAGELMDRIMSEGDDLERLSKYEQRLRNSVLRSIKELRQLREEMYISGNLCEFAKKFVNDDPEEPQATEVVVEGTEVKNEPTANASDDVKTSCETAEAGSGGQQDSAPEASTGEQAPESSATEPDGSENES